MQEVKVSIGQIVPKRVVVLGGTGFVGRAFCERWSRVYPHSTLVVPTRRRHHGRDIQHLPSVELVECRTMDPIALPRLLVGADAVVNLVAILHGSAAEFKRVHVDLPSQLATACRVAGVRRVIHISALGASTNGSHLPSEYLRTKSAGEEVLRCSGLDVTILRPSVIFGAQDRFLNVFAALQSIVPLMPLACSSAQFQPVWVEDVVSALIHALTHPQTRGQVLECVGPEVFSLAELVRLAGRYAGCERLVLPIPKVLGYLQASMMQLWPGQPLLSHDNIRSMSVPNIATGQGLTLPDWGIEPARISGVAPQYLGKRGLRPQHDPWCHLADRH